MKLVVMALTTGLATGPAMAVLSGDTGQIHGRAPTVDGKLQAVFPDGVTAVADDVVVGGSQIPSHFSLTSQDLIPEDPDGDAELRVMIDTAQANLSWFRNDIPFTTDQLTTPFNHSFTQNDALRLEVSAPVIVSSTTGLHTTAEPVIHSTHYLLRGPVPYTPVISVNSHMFDVNSGFPKTGFINAQFDILMNGTDISANTDYVWRINAPWLTINSNGRITFERKPAENEIRTVNVSATHKYNGETWTWSFTPEIWFTGYETQRMNWQAAQEHCAAEGKRLPERIELAAVDDTTGGTGIREIGSIYAEWGDITHYPNRDILGDDRYWTSTLRFDSYYHVVDLTSGDSTIAYRATAAAKVICVE